MREIEAFTADFNVSSPVNVNVTPNSETPAPLAFGDKGEEKKEPLREQPTVADTIAWLLALGLSPLPVAPAQIDNPKFTGKNPSYLDIKGIPHLVSHKPFQKRQPNTSELKKWFTNSLNGIGALGSDRWAFIDLDRKQFNSDTLTPEQSQELCDAAASKIIANVIAKTSKLPPYEKTQSGGWRIVVGLRSPQAFTNFSITPGGAHVGEVLKVGRFAVMAPTVGPTGNPYEAYHRCAPEEIPIVDALEDISVHPTGAKTKPKPEQTLPLEKTPPTDTTVSWGEEASASPVPSTSMLEKYPQLRDKVFDLAQLGTEDTRKVLRGVDVKGDRSASLTLAIRDWYGWQNWCNANGIKYRGDARSLAIEAAKKMPPGKERQDYMDEERVDWILKGIDANSCTTSCEYKGGGDDEGCWKRILKLAGVKGSKSNANGKDKVVPLRSSLPKAVGGTNDNPPLPPNYGGGCGGSNPDNDDVDWRPPEAYKGHLGVWVYPKNDEPFFDAKCNFDFVVVKEFERYITEDGEPTNPDGGGLQLKVTRASDGKTKTLLISSQDYGTVKTFTAALKKRLGLGIKCRISDYDLQALLHTKLRQYHLKGGKVYTLASMIGQQPDGTRVFPSLQTDASGNPVNEDESMWVFNPHISELDYIPSPDIPLTENLNALRELIEAQHEFAQGNFMRFLLTDGWVVACLHEQEIMRLEKFMPVLNDYGDAGSGKTIAIESAQSLVWGDSGNGMIASASVSMAYERLAKTGSLPCCWDDPPSKSKKEQEALDEFVKRQYNKFPRSVRGNTQKPHSSMGITSNHCVGETLPATLSRIVGVFFPTLPLNKDAYPRLRKAMAQAPGAFRSLLTIGYNQMAVHETRKRLIPHLQNAHDRAADNWALIVWYSQRVVELAGLDIDVEAWVIENICPTLNEDQAGLNSASDFIKRLQALHTQNRAGTWNVNIVTNRSHGKCLALELNTLWDELAKVDPPAYNKKVLEAVLVNKGCVKGVTTKFDSDRDSVQTYRRELIKGVNEGLNWIPPKPPQKVSKRALLIPECLWEEFDFHPSALPPDPDDDPTPPTPINSDLPTNWGVGSESYSFEGDSYAQVTKNVTSSNVDVESVLDSSLTPSYKVTKNKSEEREREDATVELIDAQIKNDDAIDATDAAQTSKDASEKNVTLQLASNPTPETSIPQGVELVTKDCNLDVTLGVRSVTSTKTDAQTPDDNLIKLGAIATEMIHCATKTDVEILYASVSQELIEA